MYDPRMNPIQRQARPGDTVLVHYLRADIVSAGIQWWTHGAASHELCCLGGEEIIEADIGGVMHTYLDSYIRGQVRLTLKRPIERLRPAEAGAASYFWATQVARPYGWGSIGQAFLAVPTRRLILPRAPALGRALLRAEAWAFRHARPDCSALWLAGLRTKRPNFFSGYATDEVTPETVLRDQKWTETIAVWEAAP